MEDARRSDNNTGILNRCGIEKIPLPSRPPLDLSLKCLVLNVDKDTVQKQR